MRTRTTQTAAAVLAAGTLLGTTVVVATLVPGPVEAQSARQRSLPQSWRISPARWLQW